MVICNKVRECKFGDECGGAKPHEPCSECGKGPMCKKLEAECIEYVPSLEDISNRKVERKIELLSKWNGVDVKIRFL